MGISDAMINPSIVNLLEKVENRYALVTATSKRARMIIGPENDEKESVEDDPVTAELRKPLVKIDSQKPLTIAINEVDQDKVDIHEQLEWSIDEE